MRHRLFDTPIPPFAAFLVIVVVGGIATLLMVRTIDTAEFIEGQYASVEKYSGL